MKGQTQAVTAVMITGIVMGGIGTAYFWGVPMVEKRQVEQEITSTEESVLDLSEEIVSLSEQGSGAASTITVDADSITVDTKNEYIQVTKQFDRAAEQGFTWSLLRGSSFQNLSIGAGAYAIQGEDLPGVVAFQSISGEGSSEVTYRIEFRNMCSSSTGEISKIDLQTDGQIRASGTTEIRISNNGEETENVIMPEGACEGRTSRTNTVVGVQLG
jgi:hypothetical protein